jgi:hypothetical protein
MGGVETLPFLLVIKLPKKTTKNVAMFDLG